MAVIEQRVLSALANARTGLMHFAYFFVGPKLLYAGNGRAAVTLGADLVLHGQDGTFNRGALLMALDFIMTVALQAASGNRNRAATVSLQVGYNGAPIKGPLRIEAEAVEPIVGTELPMLRVQGKVIAEDGVIVLRASGLYARLPEADLKPPFETLVGAPPAAALSLDALDESEHQLLRRIETLDDALIGLAERLWGFGEDGKWQLGAHVQNRFGHAHGGLLCAFASAAAARAVSGQNRIVEFSASFLSPGLGAELEAKSEIIHLGRRTAVVRSTILGGRAKRVLEMQSVHARG